MNKLSSLLFRLLALAHFAWGLALVLLASWLAASAFRILPHMSTGTVVTNLPTMLVLAIAMAGPPAALGTWILALGRRLWTGSRPVRMALFVTHGLMLAPGAFALLAGRFALNAAARSAAHGGGLLGAIGYLPLALGACIVALALFSILVALAQPPVRAPGP